MLCALVLAWVVSPVIAFAQEVAGDALPALADRLNEALASTGSARILGIVTVAVSFLMYAWKSDKVPFSLIPRVPKEYQALASAGLGIIVSVLESLITGTPIVTAVITGVIAGATASWGYDVVKGARAKAIAAVEDEEEE